MSPSRRYHLEFDDVLRAQGIICDDTNGNSVHSRMDRGSKKYGIEHRVLDYFHSDAGIRDYVDRIVNSIGTIYHSTATDFIRIAYGHLCLDYMASKLKDDYECTYDELDWDYVFWRTLKYFKYRNFHKTFYKQRN